MAIQFGTAGILDWVYYQYPMLHLSACKLVDFCEFSLSSWNYNLSYAGVQQLYITLQLNNKNILTYDGVFHLQQIYVHSWSVMHVCHLEVILPRKLHGVLENWKFLGNACCFQSFLMILLMASYVYYWNFSHVSSCHAIQCPYLSVSCMITDILPVEVVKISTWTLVDFTLLIKD